jgi:hypothetical protein
MKNSLGCALVGVVLLLILYVLFFLLGAIEPGLAIVTLIVGILIAAGTVTAVVAWIVEIATSRRS